MTALTGFLFVLVAAGGTAVALTREPARQALMLSLFGMWLTLLFLALQAPDVALSELTVGSVALPLLLLAAVSKTREKPK